MFKANGLNRRENENETGRYENRLGKDEVQSSGGRVSFGYTKDKEFT